MTTRNKPAVKKPTRRRRPPAMKPPAEVVPDQLVTLSQLNKARPPFKDVPVRGLGSFRLNRLPIADSLKFRVRFGSVTDDAGNGDDNQILQIATEMVARSLGGDFESPEGLAAIRAMPELTSLMHAAAEVNGLNVDAEAVTVGEAKND